jgi:predicted ATPase/DNA-binding CsgD family transcriptional regulator
MGVMRSPLATHASFTAIPDCFVGRDRELDEMARLLARSRLVTLTGPPGSGKTRVVTELLSRGKLTDATCLDVSESDADALTSAVTEALSLDDPELLILDGCDRAIDACVRVLPRMLRENPALHVLVTSREALRIGGESVYRLGPLSTHDALQLFLARVGDRNHGVGQVPNGLLERICAHLDGLPLAVELAAARAGVMSASELAARLTERIDVLAGGDRSAPVRQHSLAAAIEWSREMLGGSERDLLARLAIFAGPFCLEDVEQVCTDSGLSQSSVLDGIATLISKSLLECEISEHGTRYTLLGVVRRYVRSVDSCRWDDALWLRYVEWCTGIAERQCETGGTAGLTGKLDLIEAGQDDQRAALAWCQGHGRLAEGRRLAAALAGFWLLRGRLTVGCDHLAALLRDRQPQGAAESAATGRLLADYGALLCARGAFDAGREAGQRALEACESEADAAGTARAQLLLAHIDMATGTASGTRMLDRLTAAVGDSDSWWPGMAAAMMGYAQWHSDRLPIARRACAAYTAAAATSDPAGMAAGLIALGKVCADQGDLENAARILSQGLGLSRELGFAAGIAAALHGLAQLAASRGQPAQARQCLDEAVTTAMATDSPMILAPCLNGLAAVLLDDGELCEAKKRFRDVLALGEPATSLELASALLGLSRADQRDGYLSQAASLAEEAATVAQRAGHRALTARAIHALGVIARRQGNHSAAWAMLRDSLELRAELGLLPEVAVCLEALGGVAAEQERADLAGRILGAASGLRQNLGSVRSIAEQGAYDADLLLLRSAGPEQKVERAFAQGQQEPLRDVLAWLARQSGPRRRAAAGWAGLTRSEEQVARLAATGLTNRQIGGRLFISPRTVQTHLSHVFAKLGVTSRRELADHAAARSEHLSAAAGLEPLQALGLPVAVADVAVEGRFALCHRFSSSTRPTPPASWTPWPAR